MIVADAEIDIAFFILVENATQFADRLIVFADC